MQETNHKENIDLDELVSTLLKERAEGGLGKASGAVSPADVFAASLEEQEETPEDEVVDIDTVSPVMVDPQPTEEEGELTEAPVPEKRYKEKKAKKPKRERKPLFRKARQEEEEEDADWYNWDLKPIGHYRVSDEVQPTDASSIPSEEIAPQPIEEQPEEPSAVTGGAGEPVDEFLSVQAVDETITMTIPVASGVVTPSDATRVIEMAPKPTDASPTAVEEAPVSEQLPDQLSMEEMVRVEEMEEPPEGVDEDPSERLQRTREEKVRQFTFSGEEEEENEPEEEVVEEPEEEPEIEDFHSYEDTKAVAHELRYRCRTAALSMLFTGLLELVLLLLCAATALMDSSPLMSMSYLTVQMFGLGLMLVLNYSLVGRGFSGLFRLSANGDSGASLAVIVALLGIVPHFADSNQPLPMWAPVAGLLMLLASIANYLQARRVMRGFTFVSYPGGKYAASMVEDEKALLEIGRRAAMEGDASVGYFRKTAFLSDYLANAYEPDRGDDWARVLTPVAFGLSVILSIVLAIAGYVDDFWSWLSVFVGFVCLSMPAVSLTTAVALCRCSNRMLARGGFIVGWKAVRRFGHPDALAVDVADLYPDESMLLHGIKTFAGAHIDDAILDAASLSVRAGGPLSLVFRRIIENKEELLHEVDSLVYEQGMGLSGWVDGRRVLVGNRRLLENHGVDVPSSDYEARYAKDGRRLVYLSTAGELSAMFVVSYLPDEAITDALQRLTRSRVMLLIRSCDQNITAESLCEDFDLSEFYVEVLPAVAGRLYTQLTEGESESAPAELASNGHILGTAQALSSCRNLSIQCTVALIVQTLLAAGGLLLGVLWTVQSSPLMVLGAGVLIAASALVSCVLPLFKRL